MKEIFTPSSKSKAGKIIFYTFEIAALIVGVLSLILCIYTAAIYGGGAGFMAFLSGLATLAFDVLVLFGIGKIVDLMMAKKEAKQQKEENKTEE